MEFWKTDIGKILSYGIHEHNGAISLISGNIGLCKKYIELENTEKALECLERAKQAIKRANEGIDYIYIKLKEKEK